MQSPTAVLCGGDCVREPFTANHITGSSFLLIYYRLYYSFALAVYSQSIAIDRMLSLDHNRRYPFDTLYARMEFGAGVASEIQTLNCPLSRQ